MVLRLIILTIWLFVCSCSKLTRLDGVYYSDHQDCLVLNDKYGMIENRDDYIKDNLTLTQSNRKLRFRSIGYSSKGLFFKRSVDKYYFRILTKAADTMMVSPSSKLARKYFHNRDSIVFKTKDHFADATNYFTRIIYHSSRCFGWCNDLYLELDYSGNLKVTNKGNGYSGPDSAKNDNYFGKVSSSDMDRLKSILKYSQLKTLEWPTSRRCYDAPELTLILYQNDKRYYFKLNAPCVPLVSRQLTIFLYNFFKYPSLKKIDTTFTYEK